MYTKIHSVICVDMLILIYVTKLTIMRLLYSAVRCLNVSVLLPEFSVLHSLSMLCCARVTISRLPTGPEKNEKSSFGLVEVLKLVTGPDFWFTLVIISIILQSYACAAVRKLSFMGDMWIAVTWALVCGFNCSSPELKQDGPDWADFCHCVSWKVTIFYPDIGMGALDMTAVLT